MNDHLRRQWRPNNHGNYILIATDGACRNNGRADAIAGCGIYWGRKNTHNKSFQLDDGVLPTNLRVELSAAIYALRKFRNIFSNGGYKHYDRIDNVVIKTGRCVVMCMTAWIVGWRADGYVDCCLRIPGPICNTDLILELDGLCHEIERDLGVQPCFWRAGT